MMQKKKGIHLYINIKNLDELVIVDYKDEKLNHIIHQMNTLFTSIERYINDNYKDNVEIEKVTGSRLHLIIFNNNQIDIMMIICKFAYLLSKKFKNFPKYSNLGTLNLQFGADTGFYYGVEIDINNDVEYTSIGYPANYAAKLQSISDIGYLYISKKLYDIMDIDDRKNFGLVSNNQSKQIINKYNNGSIYCFKVDKFDDSNVFTRSQISNIDNYVLKAKELSNETNYNSMNVIEPKKQFSFENWSIKNIAEFCGTVVFSDIRGFTKDFDPNGNNLEELTNITIKILKMMYDRCIENNGVHIQFQGDREFVLFPHELQEDACVFAIKLIDEVKNVGKHIGVGISYGNLFGFKVGIRNYKDNVLLGIPVICVDKLEDLYAEEDSIAISENVYKKLEDNYLKSLFIQKGIVERIGCKYYTTRFGYKYFVENKQKKFAKAKPNVSYTKPYKKIKNGKRIN